MYDFLNAWGSWLLVLFFVVVLTSSGIPGLGVLAVLGFASIAVFVALLFVQFGWGTGDRPYYRPIDTQTRTEKTPTVRKISEGTWLLLVFSAALLVSFGISGLLVLAAVSGVSLVALALLVFAHFRRVTAKRQSDVDQMAVPELIGMVTSDEEHVRKTAVLALRHHPTATVRESLEDQVWRVRLLVLRTEDRLGLEFASDVTGLLYLKNKAALPQLAGFLKDPHPAVREAAAWMLGEIGPEANRMTAGLAGLLGDDHKEVRRMAASALGHIGPLAKTAIASLANSADDPDESVRAAATKALPDMGVEAIPHLTGLLQSKDRQVRLAATKGLGNMGPDALDAVTQTSRDEDWLIRLAATEALANMGTKAIPQLARLAELDDEHPAVRRRAAEALERIRHSQTVPNT